MLLLTAICKTFIIPSAWLKSSITCLLKNKVSKSEVKTYGGLSIIATSPRILSAIITSRTRNPYDRLIMSCSVVSKQSVLHKQNGSIVSLKL